MSAHELNELLAAAEQAAAADDYSSAERLLRDALAVQERDLGPAHPDLANTLNNLGVVCERAGRPDDAERCYRRAYAIVTTAFPPDHPFVATSRKNLEELCQQLGRPFDVAASVPEPSAEPQQAVFFTEPAPIATVEEPGDKTHAADAGPRQSPKADTAPLMPEPEPQPSLRLQLDSTVAPVKSPAAVAVPPEIAKKHDAERERTLPVGGAIIGAISLVIVLIGWIAWPSSGDRDQREHATVSQTRAAARAPVAPAPAAPPASAPSAPERAPREPSTAAVAVPTVADARLCRKLSTSGVWQCDPVASPVSSGAIYFYTRIVSPRATQVQHRWYQGDRVRQSVMLDIQANPSGYRTFSRTTVGPDRAGEWRVELRTPDGRMLHEERFTVGASR